MPDAVRFACSFLLAAAAVSCGSASPKDVPLPAPIPTTALTASSVAAILTTSSSTNARPTVSPTPVVADITTPLLPFPLSKLPPTLRLFGVVRPYRRADLLMDVCGGPDIEKRLLSENPAYEARGLARAFDNVEDARRLLLCRREFVAALGGDIPAWEVSFSLPGQSSESVHFFQLDMDRLPATAAYGQDASALTGLPNSRCFYAFSYPNKPCSVLTDAIGKWPEGKWWVSGRVQGIVAALEAYRSGKPPHPRADDVRTALENGRDFDLTMVYFPEGNADSESAHDMSLSGKTQDGMRFSRYVMHDESSAVAKEKELNQERERRLALPPRKLSDWRCTDCPPGTHDLHAQRFFASDAQDRKRVAADQFRRNGRVVDARWAHVDDPEVAKIDAKLAAAQDKRAAKVAVLLEQWINGKPPKPEAFRETQGKLFVDEIHKNMQ